jgi:hypothetical protein
MARKRIITILGGIEMITPERYGEVALNARVNKGNEIDKVDYNILGVLKKCTFKSRLNYLESSIKVDLTNILVPILRDTNIEMFRTCDFIINNTLIFEEVNKISNENIKIIKISIFNEIVRLALEASSIKNTDLIKYVNTIHSKIDKIGEKISEVMNIG